jgi:hypothetical protein
MKKVLDCVRMKREIQAQILAETEKLSMEELMAYYGDQAQKSGNLWEKLKAARQAPDWVQRQRQL